eukprot:CAMPEP_0197196080 /NCGR_PEP_ID=MMETSP1423-20130617/32162_1 /TAXON_ID=476441 /ORGANISM="Pseudo-nitzschia heimii, Strain UNC1101" /LENGTH=561 /DNA_ID=CAMNT_0042649851 /DNA_START=65 /DNA_END=1750 /DNA_ORIENTATION=+
MIRRISAAALLLLLSSAALPSAVVECFSPQPRRGVAAVPRRNGNGDSNNSRLFQEAPRYEKRGGVIRRSEPTGKGSYLLTVDADANDGNDDLLGYRAGHVLALEFRPPSASESDDAGDVVVVDDDDTFAMTEKTRRDLESNEGWMRGPYTVSFGYGGVDDDEDANVDGFKVLIKEVGYKSRVLAESKPGTPVRFGGKFKVPIAEGILSAASSPLEKATRRVVMVSSGKGSYLLTVDADVVDGNDDLLGYRAGHVLALEFRPPSEAEAAAESDDAGDVDDDDAFAMTEKTRRDLESNEGWMRGPYTVSFGYGGVDDDEDANVDGFKVLIKEVGYKSRVLAESKPGTPVRFGGKFKVPIAEGILSAASSPLEKATRRVVMVSSGVGIGPCVGAIEELLTHRPSPPIESIDLIASFRTREEISMDDAMERLLEQEDDDREKNIAVRWKPIVTSEEGRITANGPEALRDLLLASVGGDQTASPVAETHYHVIGNGRMVNEWKEGLASAGVPPSRITVEAYFDHSVPADPDAVSAIRGAVVVADDDGVSPAKATEEAVEAEPVARS